MIDRVRRDVLREALPQWIPGPVQVWLAHHWPNKRFPESVRAKARERIFAEMFVTALQEIGGFTEANHGRPANGIEVLTALQIVDEGDVADAVSCEICGGYGGLVFVTLEDGRWACYDNKSADEPILCTNLPSVDELYRVGLLADAEYMEMTGYGLGSAMTTGRTEATER